MNCPECGKVMLDMREHKQNAKAPDFICPDASCLNDKGYRTGAWLPKGKAPTMAPSAPSYQEVMAPRLAASTIVPPSAPQPQPGPSTRDEETMARFWDSLDDVMAGLMALGLYHLGAWLVFR